MAGDGTDDWLDDLLNQQAKVEAASVIKEPPRELPPPVVVDSDSCVVPPEVLASSLKTDRMKKKKRLVRITEIDNAGTPLPVHPPPSPVSSVRSVIRSRYSRTSATSRSSSISPTASPERSPRTCTSSSSLSPISSYTSSSSTVSPSCQFPSSSSSSSSSCSSSASSFSCSSSSLSPPQPLPSFSSQPQPPSHTSSHSSLALPRLSGLLHLGSPSQPPLSSAQTAPHSAPATMFNPFSSILTIFNKEAVGDNSQADPSFTFSGPTEHIEEAPREIKEEVGTVSSKMRGMFGSMLQLRPHTAAISPTTSSSPSTASCATSSSTAFGFSAPSFFSSSSSSSIASSSSSSSTSLSPCPSPSSASSRSSANSQQTSTMFAPEALTSPPLTLSSLSDSGVSEPSLSSVHAHGPSITIPAASATVLPDDNSDHPPTNVLSVSPSIENRVPVLHMPSPDVVLPEQSHSPSSANEQVPTLESSLAPESSLQDSLSISTTSSVDLSPTTIITHNIPSGIENVPPIATSLLSDVSSTLASLQSIPVIDTTPTTSTSLTSTIETATTATATSTSSTTEILAVTTETIGTPTKTNTETSETQTLLPTPTESTTAIPSSTATLNTPSTESGVGTETVQLPTAPASLSFSTPSSVPSSPTSALPSHPFTSSTGSPSLSPPLSSANLAPTILTSTPTTSLLTSSESIVTTSKSEPSVTPDLALSDGLVTTNIVLPIANTTMTSTPTIEEPLAETEAMTPTSISPVSTALTAPLTSITPASTTPAPTILASIATLSIPTKATNTTTTITPSFSTSTSTSTSTSSTTTSTTTSTTSPFPTPLLTAVSNPSLPVSAPASSSVVGIQFLDNGTKPSSPIFPPEELSRRHSLSRTSNCEFIPLSKEEEENMALQQELREIKARENELLKLQLAQLKEEERLRLEMLRIEQIRIENLRQEVLRQEARKSASPLSQSRTLVRRISQEDDLPARIHVRRGSDSLRDNDALIRDPRRSSLENTWNAAASTQSHGHERRASGESHVENGAVRRSSTSSRDGVSSSSNQRKSSFGSSYQRRGSSDQVLERRRSSDGGHRTSIGGDLESDRRSIEREKRMSGSDLGEGSKSAAGERRTSMPDVARRRRSSDYRLETKDTDHTAGGNMDASFDVQASPKSPAALTRERAETLERIQSMEQALESAVISDYFPDRSEVAAPKEAPSIISHDTTRVKLVLDLHKIAPNVSELSRNQNNKCATCREPLKLSYFSSPPYCHYTGKLYCSKCHIGEKRPIPARLFHLGDPKDYPVCTLAREYLDAVYAIPSLPIPDVHATLHQKHQTIRMLRARLLQLAHMQAYIETCRKKDSLLLLLDERPNLLLKLLPKDTPAALRPKDVVNDNLDVGIYSMYSVRDLVETFNGKLLARLQEVVEFIGFHIMDGSCEICLSKGSYCGVPGCPSPNALIYPFQLLDVVQCDQCAAIFHQTCFKPQECPKCLRLRKRTHRT